MTQSTWRNAIRKLPLRLPLALPVLVAACATPPGQMADAAFGWHEVAVDGTPAQVFRAVMDRDRTCGNFGGAIPEGQFYPDLGRQRIDLFIAQSFGHASSGIVAGRVDIEQAPDATHVRIGARFGGEREATRWSRYIADPSLPCDS
jgi:hypothetical protein